MTILVDDFEYKAAMAFIRDKMDIEFLTVYEALCLKSVAAAIKEYENVHYIFKKPNFISRMIFRVREKYNLYSRMV